MGSDPEELGLASVTSSSCPLPVLGESGRRRRRKGRGRTGRAGSVRAPGALRPCGHPVGGGGLLSPPLEEEPRLFTTMSLPPHRPRAASSRLDDALCPEGQGGHPGWHSVCNSGNWGRNVPTNRPTGDRGPMGWVCCLPRRPWRPCAPSRPPGGFCTLLSALVLLQGSGQLPHPQPHALVCVRACTCTASRIRAPRSVAPLRSLAQRPTSGGRQGSVSAAPLSLSWAQTPSPLLLAAGPSHLPSV